MNTKDRNTWMSSVILIALAILLLGVYPARQVQAQEPITYYVIPGGTGDCTSWGTACDLHFALTNSVTGSEIWVAAGTYKPAADPAATDPRTATFQLKEGVAVYGGFAGTESSREERDPQANLSVFSGDLNGDDGENFANNGENSYHVVIGANDAILDGFTITAGNANSTKSEAQASGGGMYNEDSSPILANITFSGNSARDGGGMYNENSSPTLANITFSGNSARYGGGMFNYESSPKLTNVTFSGNSANYAGGMYNYYSSPILSSVTFNDNSADDGGGMHNSYSDPTMTNVTFSKNTATWDGGGICNLYSSPTLSSTTFSGNSANSGGGIYNYASSSPVIRNTILWGDMGGELVNDDTSSVTITSSVVQGGCPTGADCTNVIDTDPRLGTLGSYGGATQTIPLLPGSSAIDTGDDSLCPATDQRGVVRVGGCDIGAFEYDYTGIYYVTPGGWGSQDGQSWTNASDLQNALKTARSGDELWVGAGDYKPTTNLTDRIATFQLKEGVAVYGGFAGTETSRDARDPQANLTVLSGDLNGDDGENFANNGENSYHVVTGADGAILDGVTITAGNADYPASSDDLLLRYAGAGMYNKNSNPILSNITFSSNIARAGGGMYNYSSSPTLSNITFSGNSAMNNGGGMFNYDSSNPTLDNITFSGNSAVYDGGGMYNLRSSSPTLTNVTFSGNSAKNGGGMYNGTSYPVIRNSILWGNTGGEVICSEPSYATITSSIVQGGCPTGATCTNVIDIDPRLGTLGSYGGSTLTIPLLPGSSAIDAGDDSLCSATDQRGVTRVGVCDIGAFEYDYTGIYYVAPGGWGTQDGQSWTNASDLQNALKTARSGDDLWVAAGVYKPTTDLTDRIATFQLKEGVAVYGGFAGTETSREERDPQANLSVFSGDLNGDDGENFANNGENSYHVVTGADGALLDGFTITAGNANFMGSGPHWSGGGMFNENSNPILRNVTFSSNSATYAGGMYNRNSDPTLTNVTFIGNTVMDYGGGMYNYRSNPILSNVTFSGNSAVYLGGGMFNSYSYPTLTNVTFSGNTAHRGGGMSNQHSSPTLINVTLNGNSATSYGGGLYNVYSNPILTNISFSSNSAISGGGMYNNASSLPVIQNTILWGDTGGEVVNFDTSSATITSSIVQGGCPTGATCTNVIDTDPHLGPLGSYGGSTLTIPLLPGSSAIDAGDDSLCSATDQRGVTRPQGAGCDIGAFESQGFSFSNLTGTPQSTLATTAFGAPLGLTVTANVSGEPVDGGIVTFSAPVEGASAILMDNPATISGGLVSITATANEVAGSYEVIAAASGAAPASFLLSNEVAADLSVTMSTDAKPTDSKITYAITVTNAGPHAAQSVVLTNPLPTGTTLVKVTTTQGSCSAGKDKVITCQIGVMEPVQSVSITLTIKQVKSTPPIINTATVISVTADPNLENNTASVTLQ